MATDRDVELIRTRDCDFSVVVGEIANGVSRKGRQGILPGENCRTLEVPLADSVFCGYFCSADT